MYGGLGTALVTVGQHVAAIVHHNALRHEERELNQNSLYTDEIGGYVYMRSGTYTNGDQPCVQARALQARAQRDI